MGEEEEDEASEASTEWEPLHFPRHRFHSSQAHHRSLSDSQSQLNGWSMVAIRDSQADEEGDRAIVFPPINHEGLQISSKPSSSLSHLENQQEDRELSYPPCQDNGLVLPSPPLLPSEFRSNVGAEMARWFGFAFEILRSKLTGIASLLRHFAAFGKTNWSFDFNNGMAAVVLVWWFYAAVRRRRQHLRVRKESRDQLILLMKEKDARINQLLHQIAQMNQVLLALNRDSISGTGGLTK